MSMQLFPDLEVVTRCIPPTNLPLWTPPEVSLPLRPLSLSISVLLATNTYTVRVRW